MATISLNIAGISVGIVSDINCIYEERYSHFLSKVTPKYTIEVVLNTKEHLTPASTEFTDNESINFDNSGFTISTPNYSGYFSLNESLGKVLVSNPLSIEHFLRVLYAWLSPISGGILLHAAGIVRDNKGYIFFGPKNAGKTTITKLSGSCKILSDDMVIIKPTGNSFTVFGTPFSSVGENSGARVNAFFSLAKDDRIFIQPIPKGIAIAEVISNIPVATKSNPDLSGKVLSIVTNIIDTISCYRLHFSKEDNFWSLI